MTADPLGASMAARAVAGLLDLLVPSGLPSAGELLAEAQRRTGRSDLGPDWDGEGLERLLASARQEARLNGLGRMTLKSGIIRALEQRLLWAHERSRPGAVDAPPRRPIVIAALPRTGSSLLHRLLAAHPDALFVPLWLGIRPLPAPDLAEWRAGGSGVRGRAARVTCWAVRTFEPAMMTKHDIAPHLPVECAYVTMSTFEAVQWWAVWPLYTYATWLASVDPTRSVRVYREVLSLAQAGLPGSHWVLKSPGHLGSLAALATALPDALFVMLHRDPVTVVASTDSLFHTAHAVMAEAVDLDRVRSINTEALASLADRAVDARRRLDEQRFVDVPYRRLVDEPLRVVRDIALRAGLRWDEEARSRVAAALAANRQGRFGAHVYAPPEPRAAEAIRERFGSYLDRFGEFCGA